MNSKDFVNKYRIEQRKKERKKELNENDSKYKYTQMPVLKYSIYP